MMSDQKKEVKSFPELLRDAFQSLNSDDDDRATEKNHVGFNKDDGDPARALLNKEKWNDEDLKEAFRIASHYKKTQLKDRWSGILESRKRYFEDIKKEKKPDGWWTPIEFENDVPIAYAGWFEGKPYKLKITESSDDVLEKRQKITLRNHDDEQIQSKIKRLMIDGTDMVEFEEEVFTKTEFVNLMVYPSNCNLFTECINALPLEKGRYREPKFFIENGHIKFPEKYFARRNDSYQKVLINALNIGPVDPELYQEGINLLRKHPKQLTLHYAIIGANIMNVIGYEDYLFTIDSVGETDTGKSFAVNLTLQMDYGISNANMNDDALRASFRHHAIANATNLPIYIEEAMMDERSLSRLKSTGKNVRGNMDKSLTMYDVLATFVFSRNTESKDVRNIDPIERKAQDKRILKFIFEKEDVITDEKEKSTGKDFFKLIEDAPGGMIYEKLKGITVTEIISKYRSLKQEEPNPIKAISLLGAWIMVDPDFKPEVTEPKQPTILDEFYSILRDEHERIEYVKGLSHDDQKDKMSTFLDKELTTNLGITASTNLGIGIGDETQEYGFKLSVHGFNLIKKSLGYDGSASAFARSFGFEYKTVAIYTRHDKCIVGKIPKEYFEEEKDDKAKTGKKEDDNNPTTKEENAEYTAEYQGSRNDYQLEKNQELKKQMDEIGL